MLNKFGWFNGFGFPEASDESLISKEAKDF
jgi:hypothetical protein